MIFNKSISEISKEIEVASNPEIFEKECSCCRFSYGRWILCSYHENKLKELKAQLSLAKSLSQKIEDKIDKRIKKLQIDLDCQEGNSNLWWKYANLIAELEELKKSMENL